MRVGVVVGSTRPERLGLDVGWWVLEHAQSRSETVRYELVDLADVALPLLNEPLPASSGEYTHDHTVRWSRTVTALDAFVFVTPEYNRSPPAALKNAIDYLFAEWHDKAAGFVCYGVYGGLRAAEALRLVLAEVKVATVRTTLGLSFYHDFVDGEPKPADHQTRNLDQLLDELNEWAGALRSLRTCATA